MRSRYPGILTAIVGLLVGATTSRADFQYTTSISPATTTFGTGSTVQFGAVTSPAGLSGSQGVNLADIVDLTVTSPNATDTGTIPYTVTMHINQSPGVVADPAGTGELSFSGLLTFTRSDTGGLLSSNQITSSLIGTAINGVSYEIDPASFIYAKPTVNAHLGAPGQGNLSALLTVVSPFGPSDTSLPEPGSVWLLGSGAVGLLAFARRRIRRSA